MRTQHWATIGFGSDNKTRILVIIILAIVKELSHLATWQAQLETLKMDFQEKKVNKNSFIEECEVVWDKMKEVGECEVLCTPVKYCGEVLP